MNTIKTTLSAVLGLVILVASASAQQKGAERLASKNFSKPTTMVPSDQASKSDTKNHMTVLQSHIKSLGTIGKTDRYEVNQVKIRDLFGPQLAAVLVYDRESDTLLVVGPASAPGFGVALVNGASTVGGSFLFGSNLRPDRTSVSNGSSSSSEGGNANAKAGSSSKSSARNDNSNTSVNVNNNSNKNSNHNDNDVNVRNNNKNNNNNSNNQSQGQNQGQIANGGQGGQGGDGGNGGNGGGFTPPGHQPGHGQPGHGND